MHTQGRQRFSSQGLREAPTFKRDQPSKEMVSQLCLPLTSPPERTPSPPSCDPTHSLPGSHLSTSVNACYAICPHQYNSAQLSGRKKWGRDKEVPHACRPPPFQSSVLQTGSCRLVAVQLKRPFLCRDLSTTGPALATQTHAWYRSTF